MVDRPDSFRMLFVGDVHGHWTEVDSRFVEDGEQDLVVFVGDLGDEDVTIVRRISELDTELVVVLGNHDAWQSFGRRESTPELREMLGLLGEDHIGYARRELPRAGLTLIGARPFSWGGRDLRSPELYGELFGVTSHEESANRIAELARDAEHEDLLIVAHNGPLGLSQAPGDIWGKDFGRPGGDWGDRDLRLAVDAIAQSDRRLRALVAGHMHDRLLFPKGAQRRRFARREGVDYINPAVVPRIRRDPEWGDLHHFVKTEWRAGQLLDLEEIWIDERGELRRSSRPDFSIDD
jgi:uncharacterized protein (TIGR04168 family)